MFQAIIQFSLQNKLLVLLGVLAIAIWGIISASNIPLDAVPDITNNQVQIVTSAPTFAPEEVEQLITYPLEAGMTNIPNVVEVRSISRYGLSVITIVFEEDVELMLARQYVQEQLNTAQADLPDGVQPELMPITTGLGEIYQYVLTVDKAHAHLYDATALRTLQDWIVKRQLNGTEGIIETSSFGGYVKQYEVAINPTVLRSYGLTVDNVFSALENGNENSGGSYIERGSHSFYIRMEGRAQSLEDIGKMPIHSGQNHNIRIRDVAEVRIGAAKRYGAMTMDGKGEVVGGITLMLKGANSSEALENVKKRMETVQASLPEGVSVLPYLDRSKLIGKTINTATKNLIEGGLIVIFVLLLLLGNLRAGLIVASVIPLSMLFALGLMDYFGVSANLMSLGAIDFGIVIDGAVIIVENLLHVLALGFVGQRLSAQQMDNVVGESTSKIYRSAAFGVLIILLVFVPILTLEGTEGKTFRPMAQTVAFAIMGSFLLSLTYVPVMASLFLSKKITAETGISAKIVGFLQRIYRPFLHFSLKNAWPTVGAAVLAFVFSILLFQRMGAEFIPTLEEGDIAMQQSIKAGSSLQESIRTSTEAEKILLQHFPEVLHVVSKIGTAEVPTDPMAIEDADIMIILKEKDEWTSATTREELMEKMKEKLNPIAWASFEFTQPIQLRFNELMTGAKSDISIKIFGEDVVLLKQKADETAKIIETIQGAGDVKVDQTDGLQQLSVQFDRDALAQYGVSITEANRVLRAAFAGETVGSIYEEERNFDLVVRLAPAFRKNLELSQLTVHSASGRAVPMSAVAQVVPKESPMLISREQARRFINIGVNVRNRDVASLVGAIQSDLAEKLTLPAGYEIQYGGQFEVLEEARGRLLIAVPIALAMILLLLYLAFSSLKETLMVFMAVPLSAIGGIVALELRGMPFSISSGIGFIALFGISVLNGIVLMSALKDRKMEDFPDFRNLISDAALSRLRPVLMTALVAAFGFLPMALSTGSGAEVQQPLATVVIGGLVSSTFLTLLVLPCLYFLANRGKKVGSALLVLLMFFAAENEGKTQPISDFEALYAHALQQSPMLKNQALDVDWEQLNKVKIGQWSPTEISYQGGQINYDGYDHFFSVNQGLAHFFHQKAQKEAIGGRVAVLQSEGVLLARELRFSLKKAYDEWAYSCAKKRMADSLLTLYESIETKVELRQKVGETEPLEVELFRLERAKKEQERDVLQRQCALTEELLRSMAYLPVEQELSEPPFLPLYFEKAEQKAVDSLFLQPFELKKRQLEQRSLALEKMSKTPDLNIGYFHQSLEKDFGFQGLSLGVALPLDRRAAKGQVAQIKLATAQEDNNAKGFQNKVQNRIALLYKSLNNSQLSLEKHRSSIQNAQGETQRIARLQFDLGEIDFLTFVHVQERSVAAQEAYLELLREHNALVLEWLYWTE